MTDQASVPVPVPEKEIDEEEQQYLQELAREDFETTVEPSLPSEMSEGEIEEQEEAPPPPAPSIPTAPATPATPQVTVPPERLYDIFDSRLRDIHTQLKELKELKEPKAQPSETPPAVKTKPEITPDRLAKLKEEFPELAELLAHDLNNLLASPQFDPLSDLEPRFSDYDKKLKEEREAREKDRLTFELRILNQEHPDWRELASYVADKNGLVRWSNPEFGAWVLTQPADAQERILDSNDAFEIAGYLNAFKKTLKQPPKDTLTKAVQPKSIARPRNTVTDEEERLFREELEKEDY